MDRKTYQDDGGHLLVEAVEFRLLVVLLIAGGEWWGGGGGGKKGGGGNLFFSSAEPGHSGCTALQ